LTGREIVKFILSNNLLDKLCFSDTKDSRILRFVDTLPNDEQAIFICYEDGRCRRIVNDMSDMLLVDQINTEDILYPNLKTLDSFISEEDVPSFTMTFRQWLRTKEDSDSIIHYIVDYANLDSNFGNNCKTYNKVMSYLEGKDVEVNVLRSAGVAWTQYLRECRELH